MAQPLIKKEMILQRMVEHMQAKQVYVTRKGKKLIPQCIDDIPPRLKRHTIKGKLNMHRQKAYNQLRYELIDKPARAEKGRFIHNENTEGKYRTWTKQDIEELTMCTSELGYTQGVKKASENLNRSLKSCSMAYSRYFPNASKDDVIDAKPITNSYTARTGRVEEITAKKLVVNLSSTMTCTIQDNGLITVDFKS
jgi:hypothetical protein